MRVSPACDRCYAAAIAKRFDWHDNDGRDLWDVHAERKRTSEAYWRGPVRWNRDALAAGERRRVFCASMADVFDNHAAEAWRVELWDLIRATPALIWVLLSKRPQNAAAMLPPDWGDGWPNVWLGTTVENNLEAARRIPYLAGIPAALRFLSVEPLLEAVDLAPWLDRLHWVICGGESGAGARPTQPDWMRNLRDQVHAAGARHSSSNSARTERPGSASSIPGGKIRRNGRKTCACSRFRGKRNADHECAGDTSAAGRRHVLNCEAVTLFVARSICTCQPPPTCGAEWVIA